METLENCDPRAFDSFWRYYPGADYSPYEQLIQIHKVVEDTNEEFFDSLVMAIVIAASIGDEDFEYDFVEEGVCIDRC